MPRTVGVSRAQESGVVARRPRKAGVDCVAVSGRILAVFKNLQYLDFIWFPSRAMGALKFGFGPSVKSSKHLPENLDKSK